MIRIVKLPVVVLNTIFILDIGYTALRRAGVNSAAQGFSGEDTMTDDSYFNI